MKLEFADRMAGASDSFIREILKVTQKPEIISFAGGLPNPELFPAAQIADSAARVIREEGANVLQYATTEGYLPLREFISQRYQEKHGLEIPVENILIVNGSQQGIDLVSKIFLNKGDGVVIEQPGYLGAIQAISLYEPQFYGVKLSPDGMDLDVVENTLLRHSVKFVYSVPSFQNPSGLSYSSKVRQQLAEILKKYDTVLLEDNPYGELRFQGEVDRPVKSYLGDLGILMGSFSKVTVPGIRLGWVCADKPIMDKLKIVKQASDLHSNYLAQRVLHQYLMENSLDEHIEKIIDRYRAQRNCMVEQMEKWMPPEVTFTRPDGGMFLWGTLPEDISAMELLEKAIQEKVAFVPGEAFYLNGKGKNTFRLNFSNSDEKQIEEGVERLAEVISNFIN